MFKKLYWIPYSLLYLLSLLPFPVIFLISDGLYFILYYLIRYRKDVVRMNLRNSFPEKSEQELLRIEKKYFAYLADNLMENVKLLSMSKRSIQNHFRLKNPEVVQAYFDKKQSILLAMSHYGNWELSAPGITSLLPFKSLLVYKPLSNKFVEKIVNGVRSQFGAEMVPMKQAIRTITEHRDQVYLAVLVSDQTPTRHEKNYFIPFLNQPTSVFQGLEKIGKLTGNPIVYMHINVIKRGYYEASFKVLANNPIETKPFEITEKYNRELEEIIRQQPEYWLWSHRRWKHKPPIPHENPS